MQHRTDRDRSGSGVLFLTRAVRTHVVPRGALRRLSPSRPAKVTATWWPGCERALLVAEVDDALLARLRPWFARKLDDHVEIPRHPDARVKRGAGRAQLYIGPYAIGNAAVVDSSWQQEETCTVALLPPGLTRGDCLNLAAQFAVLLDLGHALVAEAPLV